MTPKKVSKKNNFSSSEINVLLNKLKQSKLDFSERQFWNFRKTKNQIMVKHAVKALSAEGQGTWEQ